MQRGGHSRSNFQRGGLQTSRNLRLAPSQKAIEQTPTAHGHSVNANVGKTSRSISNSVNAEVHEQVNMVDKNVGHNQSQIQLGGSRPSINIKDAPSQQATRKTLSSHGHFVNAEVSSHEQVDMEVDDNEEEQQEEEEQEGVEEGDGSAQTPLPNGSVFSHSQTHPQPKKTRIGLAGAAVRDFEPRQPAFGKMKEIVHGHFDGDWTSVSKVPSNVKDLWFKVFEKCFEWNVPRETMMKTFIHQAGKHIRNIFKVHREKKTKPSFTREDQWKRIEHLRKTDPKLVNQSKVNKRNRASEKAKAAGVFRGGSRSLTKWVEYIEKDTGKKPMVSDIVRQLWQTEDGVWTGTQPAAIVEEFDRLVTQITPIDEEVEGASHDSMTSTIGTELWIKACKEVNDGKPFGLGEAGTALIRSGMVATINSVNSISTEVEPLKDEIKDIRNEMKSSHATLQAEVRASLQEFMQEQRNLLRQLLDNQSINPLASTPLPESGPAP